MLKSALLSFALVGSILLSGLVAEPSEEGSTASAPTGRQGQEEQRQQQHEDVASVRFGISTDAHLMGRGSPGNEALFGRFVDAMIAWRPDFVIDLGDFSCQVGQGQTSGELHDGQLEGLIHHVATFARVPCPRYHAIGNHDVGWIRGGDEVIKPRDLYGRSHGGEDITKEEFIAQAKIAYRYYSFDAKGFHFIVLDANNARDNTAPPPGRDGVVGGYFVGGTQKQWLAADLAANREKLKVVFCHQELHHTPQEGSGEGGDVPFPPVGKEGSYVDNGWELRHMFTADGRVLACFFGHKHRNRWTVYGGVHYITLAATHWGGSFAKVTISDKLYIQGAGNQRSYVIPLAKELSKRTRDNGSLQRDWGDGR